MILNSCSKKLEALKNPFKKILQGKKSKVYMNAINHMLPVGKSEFPKFAAVALAKTQN